MAYEQRDLSGSLFKNDKREKDTHPNLTGTVMIGGVEYWASGWTKERANGEKWISLSFKPKEAKQGYSGDQRTQRSAPAGYNDLDEPPF
jgi:hypothetical protein